MNSRSARVAIAGAAVAVIVALAVVTFRRDAAPPPPPSSTAAATERAPARTPPRDEAPAPTPAPQAATTSTDTVRVFGRVTDAATGNPIAGARILSFDVRSSQSSPDGVAVASSDAEGRYDVALESDKGRSLFAAEADGYTRQVGRRAQPVIDDVGPEGHQIDFALAAGGGTITGLVVDGAGAPIEGARVGSTWLRPADAAPQDFDGWVAIDTTGADGRFVLDALPVGKSFAFPATAPGFLPTLSEEIAVGSETTIVLEPSEASVTGTVVSHRGRSIPGLNVSLRPNDDRTRTRAELMGCGGSVQTDDTGAFSFPALRAGSYAITISWNGEPCVSGQPFCQQFELARGESRHVELRLPAPKPLVGRVFDVATGDGVAGVELSDGGIRQYGSAAGAIDEGASTRSKSDGSYRLDVTPDIRGGTSVLFKLPAGWVAIREWQPDRFYVGEFAGLESPRHDLALSRGAILRGTVVQADETTPVPSVKISADSWSTTGGESRFRGEGKTGADGTFELAVPSGRTLEVSASTSDQTARAEVAVPESGNPAPVTLVLEAFASVAGRVTAGGKPVDKIHVSLARTLPGGGSAEVGQGQSTDADGRYEVRQVRAGTMTISLGDHTAAARNLRLPEPRSITLAPGERAIMDFELDWGAVIEGVVSDESGAPIKGAHVDLSIREGSGGVSSGRFRAETDAEGYYAIGGLDETIRPHALSVSASGYFSEYRQIASIDDSPVNFVLKASPPIPLLVCSGSPANPVPSYKYRVVHRTTSGSSGYFGRDWTAVDSPDGRAQLVNIAATSHRLEVVERVAGPDGERSGRSAIFDFNVHRDAPPDPIVVDLGAGTRVAGRVIDQQGAPVAGLRISLYPPNTMSSEREFEPSLYVAPTDEGGGFVFASVTPASYTLGVWKESCLHMLPVDVPADRPMEPLEIAVALTGSVDVVVRDGEGNSRESGIAYVIEPRGNYGDPVAGSGLRGVLAFDDDAHARIDGIPFVPMTIAVTMPDGRTGSAEFSANRSRPDQRVVVDLRGEVAMTGTVRINGALWTGTPFLYIGSGAPLKHLGGGTYRAAVRPESTCLFVVDEQHIGIEKVAVPSGVAEFARDFDLLLAEASVVVLAPSGHSVPPGSVSLSLARPTYSCDQGASRPLRNDSALFEHMPAGTYVAKYRSSDALWSGKSEPTVIAVGVDNALTIEIAPANELVRLGTWDTARMQPGSNSLTFDASAAAQGKVRTIRLVLRHDGGEGSLEFVRASVASRSGNVNSQISALAAPEQATAPSAYFESSFDGTGGATLTLDAIPRGNGTCTGTVYMKAY